MKSFVEFVAENSDEIAKKTSRNSGAVNGSNSLVTRYMKKILPEKGAKILDYGAGHAAQSSSAFRDHHEVHAYDLHHNPELHDKDALKKKDYTHAMSANCLNVHPDIYSIGESIKKIHKTLKKGGHFVCNLPESPRKGDFIADDVEGKLKDHFGESHVKRISGKVEGVSNSISRRGPLWHCVK